MASLQSCSCARGSVTHAHRQMHTNRHRHTAGINTHRSICLHNFGSCPLCFSSASRRILVVVSAHKFKSPISPLILSHLNLGPCMFACTATIFFNLSQCLELVKLAALPPSPSPSTTTTHISTHYHPSVLAAIQSGAQNRR